MPARRSFLPRAQLAALEQNYELVSSLHSKGLHRECLEQCWEFLSLLRKSSKSSSSSRECALPLPTQDDLPESFALLVVRVVIQLYCSAAKADDPDTEGFRRLLPIATAVQHWMRLVSVEVATQYNGTLLSRACTMLWKLVATDALDAATAARMAQSLVKACSAHRMESSLLQATIVELGTRLAACEALEDRTDAVVCMYEAALTALLQHDSQNARDLYVIRAVEAYARECVATGNPLRGKDFISSKLLQQMAQSLPRVLDLAGMYAVALAAEADRLERIQSREGTSTSPHSESPNPHQHFMSTAAHLKRSTQFTAYALSRCKPDSLTKPAKDDTGNPLELLVVALTALDKLSRYMKNAVCHWFRAQLATCARGGGNACRLSSLRSKPQSAWTELEAALKLMKPVLLAATRLWKQGEVVQVYQKLTAGTLNAMSLQAQLQAFSNLKDMEVVDVVFWKLVQLNVDIMVDYIDQHWSLGVQLLSAKCFDQAGILLRVAYATTCSLASREPLSGGAAELGIKAAKICMALAHCERSAPVGALQRLLSALIQWHSVEEAVTALAKGFVAVITHLPNDSDLSTLLAQTSQALAGDTQVLASAFEKILAEVKSQEAPRQSAVALRNCLLNMLLTLYELDRHPLNRARVVLHKALHTDVSQGASVHTSCSQDILHLWDHVKPCHKSTDEWNYLRAMAYSLLALNGSQQQAHCHFQDALTVWRLLSPEKCSLVMCKRDIPVAISLFAGLLDRAALKGWTSLHAAACQLAVALFMDTSKSQICTGLVVDYLATSRGHPVCMVTKCHNGNVFPMTSVTKLLAGSEHVAPSELRELAQQLLRVQKPSAVSKTISAYLLWRCAEMLSQSGLYTEAVGDAVKAYRLRKAVFNNSIGEVDRIPRDVGSWGVSTVTVDRSVCDFLDSQHQLATMHEVLGSPDEALACVLEGLNLSEKYGLNWRQATFAAQQGSILCHMNKLQDGDANVAKAHQLVEESVTALDCAACRGLWLARIHCIMATSHIPQQADAHSTTALHDILSQLSSVKRTLMEMLPTQMTAQLPTAMDTKAAAMTVAVEDRQLHAGRALIRHERKPVTDITKPSSANTVSSPKRRSSRLKAQTRTASKTSSTMNGTSTRARRVKRAVAPSLEVKSLESVFADIFLEDAASETPRECAPSMLTTVATSAELPATCDCWNRAEQQEIPALDQLPVVQLLADATLYNGETLLLLGAYSAATESFQAVLGLTAAVENGETTAPFANARAAAFLGLAQLQSLSRDSHFVLGCVGGDASDNRLQHLLAAYAHCKQAPLLLQRVCRMLAEDYLRCSNSALAFFHHQLSLGTSARLQHASLIHTKCRYLWKEAASAANQGAAYPSQECLQGMLQALSLQECELTEMGANQATQIAKQLLPDGLVVCSLSTSQDGAHSDAGRPSAIMISRLTAADEPLLLRVASATAQGSDQVEHRTDFTLGKAAEELSAILESSRQVCLTEANAKKWWLNRQKLDRQLQALIGQLESELLGPWRCLLLPDAEDSVLRAAFHRHAVELAEHLQPLAKDAVDPLLVRLLLQGSDTLLEDDLCCALEYVLAWTDVPQPRSTRNQPQQLEQLAAMFFEHYQMATRSSSPEASTSRHPIILIPDVNFQAFPLESMPALRAYDVYRMPSLGATLAQLVRFKHASRGTPAINLRDTFYLLNPGGDLSNTQAVFKDWFAKQTGWQGKVGEQPSKAECTDAYLQHDMFVYCGHNSALQYASALTLRQADRCAACFDMGCSSSKLKSRGMFEPTGSVSTYVSAGCPMAIGNLWDVTDGEIDRFSKAVLKQWLQWEAAGKGLPLARALHVGRASCKLPYLIGSAPIVYGVPTTLSKSS